MADRLLPNGSVKGNGIGQAMHIPVGGFNNHAHDNVVGYIDAQDNYINYSLHAGCPEGHAADAREQHCAGAGECRCRR